MITEEQRKERVNYLGSSDAAGVLGMSRWKTPLSVWAEKTGQFVTPEVETEAAELGRELENYVAKRFERKTGKKVVEASDTFFHSNHNFLGANIDRLVENEDAILEAKTCSAWKSRDWEGEDIPQEYILQAYHQMMITRRRKVYLAVLIGNQDFKIKELNWDEKMISRLMKEEVSFWNEFVIPKVMPGHIMRQDTDVLLGLFPVAHEGEVVSLKDDTDQLIETLKANKQDLKMLEGFIEQNENALKAMLGDAEAGKTSLYEVRWSNMKVKRLDTKALETAYPDIARQFRPEKIQRRFSYKPLKGD